MPMLIDRIAYVLDHSAVGADGWDDPDTSPVDALGRNFWVLRDRRRLDDRLREHIGIDHICLESDYPHADWTWPDTQESRTPGSVRVARRSPQVDVGEHVKLFRHPVPQELQIP